MAVPEERAERDEAPGLGLSGPRTRQLLALEFGSAEEFDDPRLEWRRLFSELLGTFMLVLVAAGGGILHGQNQISLAAAVVSPGLMVMAIILFTGAVSGAHLNPACRSRSPFAGTSPGSASSGYIIVQLIGATLACLFLDAVFGNIHHLGATSPGPGYADWHALLMEVVLTATLVSVSTPTWLGRALTWPPERAAVDLEPTNAEMGRTVI